MKKWSLLIIILFVYQLVSAQQKINPNGYNVFYYPNGVKASEGYMKNGKPDGYWINYYPNGKKRSEGIQRNGKLDSIWIFYTELGDTAKKISYYRGKKNGWYIVYYTQLDSNFIKNIPKAKYLYADDIKQGPAYFYYPDGKLWKKLYYKDGRLDGTGFEYDKDGRIITVYKYSFGRLADVELINRYNKQGQKTGIWREYYENGQIKWEANYVEGKLNGYYKEYSPFGALKKFLLFENDKPVLDTNITQIQNPKVLAKTLIIKEEKYPDGKLKYIGTYKDTIPVGLHKYYLKNGQIKAILYSETGVKIAEGYVDSLNKKIGKWTYFYPDGKIYAIGQYKNNKKTGKWTYFYPNGQKLQFGSFENDIPDGQWTFYYPNGKIHRIEFYSSGLHEGPILELSPEGDTILKANYIDGLLNGQWYLKVGDILEIGQYSNGKKTGIWKTFYLPEQKIKCIDHYQNGYREGKHICFYPNGAVREKGEYLSDKKNGTWYFYYPNGLINLVITYSLDEIVNINYQNVEEE